MLAYIEPVSDPWPCKKYQLSHATSRGPGKG